VPRHDVELGVPAPGAWTEILNTDAQDYGGAGVGNLGEVKAAATPRHGLRASVRVTLPPLGAVMLRGPVLTEEQRQAMARTTAEGTA
jgi:1,4-alpha-glucan branching enzyme